ncbi:MAG: hypothetical protein WBX27_08045 [Specibacter sp.]
MPSRFQLKGPSLAALKWQLVHEYGQRARIVRAERVQVGGLFGLGADTSYEVTVEVDGPPLPASAPSRAAAKQAVLSGRVVEVGQNDPAPTRRGLSALLAEADKADGEGTALVDPVEPATAKPDFGAILAKLAVEADDGGKPSAEPVRAPVGAPSAPPAPTDSTAPASPRAAAVLADGVVAPSTGAGDLLVLVGLRDAPLGVATSMLRELNHAGGAMLRTAGGHRVEGVEHVLIDSPGVKKAQALAAVDNKPLLVAFSIGAGTSSKPAALSALRPDQLWLVVDAAHKPEDTAAWVRQICWFSTPDALAVVGSRDTETPETVNELGIPVGWLDGQQAQRPTL